MKKKLVFGLVMILALACVLVSCNSEVSADNGAGSAKTGSIVIGQEASKGIGYSVDYSYEIESLYWFYTAEKKDDGYRIGETRDDDGNLIQTAVKTAAGLNGTTLPNNYAYGLWELKFYGYESASDAGTEDKVVFYGSVSSFLVDKDHNYTDVNLEVSHAATKIEFETISFKFDHEIASTANLTLSITDGAKGSGDVKNIGSTEKTWTLSGPDSDGNYTVSFSNIDYVLAENADITGEHTMVFTLSQVLSGVGNTTIEAANYTLVFNVNAGTTTTISGDMTKNVETGDITINSAALSVPVILSPKVVPIDSESILGEGASAVATVKTQTTVTNGDLSVTYPVGAVIASVSATTIDSETSTSDANTGFEYVSNVPSASSIVIETYQTVKQYELTLNVDSNNDKLLTITKKIGKGLTIDAIYHNGTLMETSPAVSPAEEHEYYSYDSATGVLTLYVFTASPFDIIMKADTSVEIIHVNEVAATCTTSGMQAYDYYMDGETKVIVGGKDEDDLVIPATGHIRAESPTYYNNFAAGKWQHATQCTVDNAWIVEDCIDENNDNHCDLCNHVLIYEVYSSSDLHQNTNKTTHITAGYYKLMNDVQLDTQSYINGNVVIDLNGHTLEQYAVNSSADAQFRNVGGSVSSSLTLCSSANDGSGEVKGRYGVHIFNGTGTNNETPFVIECKDNVVINTTYANYSTNPTFQAAGQDGHEMVEGFSNSMAYFIHNSNCNVVVKNATLKIGDIAQVNTGLTVTFENCQIISRVTNGGLISGSGTIVFNNCSITTMLNSTSGSVLDSSDPLVVFENGTTVNGVSK